ncbi:MAG: hypothetical protein WCG23_03135 [bacterium]
MSGYKGSIPKKQYIDMPERILSSLSYLTSGMVGFVWLIITHLRGKSLSSFARFHIFQSIFLSIIIYVASILLNIIASVVQIIPFFGTLVMNIIYYLVQYPLPLPGGQSIVGLALIIFYFYLAFYAFTGRYGRIPWISDMVKQMV